MADVPILNPALKVEVVGLTIWKGSPLAVLITPWCMNLVLLPAKDGKAESERTFYRFPSGDFAFLRGSEPEIGEYHSCALFSPMSQFADQEGARAVAEATLAALFASAGGKTAEVPARAKLTRRGFLSAGLSGR